MLHISLLRTANATEAYQTLPKAEEMKLLRSVTKRTTDQLRHRKHYLDLKIRNVSSLRVADIHIIDPTQTSEKTPSGKF